MRKIVKLVFLLAAWQVLLPALLLASTDLSTSVTSGPDHYLANYTSLNIGLIDNLFLDIGYGYSNFGPINNYDVQNDMGTEAVDLRQNPEPVWTYNGGLSADLTPDFRIRGGYSITPKVEGYAAAGFNAGFTVAFTGFDGGEAPVSKNFYTAIDFDYSRTDNKYDVHTDSFTVYYRNWRGRYWPIHIAAEDYIKTIKQTSWSLGITETFYDDTYLYLNYSRYNYNPDIKEDIVLYKARQNNFRLFMLTPGLNGFPEYTYEMCLAQNFFSFLNISVDYLHLELLQFSYNDNGTPFNLTVGSLLDDSYEVAGVSADSYTLGVDYYLNTWLTLNANFNLYREVYKNKEHYYSFGIIFTF